MVYIHYFFLIFLCFLFSVFQLFYFHKPIGLLSTLFHINYSCTSQWATCQSFPHLLINSIPSQNKILLFTGHNFPFEHIAPNLTYTLRHFSSFVLKESMDKRAKLDLERKRRKQNRYKKLQICSLWKREVKADNQRSNSGIYTVTIWHVLPDFVSFFPSFSPLSRYFSFGARRWRGYHKVPWFRCMALKSAKTIFRPLNIDISTH